MFAITVKPASFNTGVLEEGRKEWTVTLAIIKHWGLPVKYYLADFYWVEKKKNVENVVVMPTQMDFVCLWTQLVLKRFAEAYAE